MKTKGKETFKSQGYVWEWDTKVDTITYFKELEDFKEKLDSRGIATSTGEMATAGVAIMYNIHYFAEDKMIRWERQTGVYQASMDNVKKYFTKLYRELLQYSKASKGQTRFNDSANHSYEKPQARDEEDSTAIFFCADGNAASRTDGQSPEDDERI